LSRGSWDTARPGRDERVNDKLTAAAKAKTAARLSPASAASAAPSRRPKPRVVAASESLVPAE